jgi:3-dehydro-L-gulonate 2-dehydrogenase
MKIPFVQLKSQLTSILVKHGFFTDRADECAHIFASNSRDGVHSHGINRFPTFVEYVQKGWISVNAEPEVTSVFGCLEKWDGRMAPGVYLASRAVDRAVEIAASFGMGCVAVKNSNHWMRGGTYGWRAADKGCIAICGTNSIANMPPYLAKDPTLGNNPLVIAVPRSKGHIVLDMAMSQFSYGKLNEYKMSNRKLPVAGGYDEEGNLTDDPGAIISSQRTLPAGFWKGSGLSIMMDLLVTVLSDGRSVSEITRQGSETGVSQFFICIKPEHLREEAIEAIIEYAKTSQPAEAQGSVRYPGERTLQLRKRSEAEGIEVNDEIWKRVLELNGEVRSS